ncbi:NADPH:adrenodoxin oxidoreductase, mitochondrial-like isoform X2 [Physella acuta]|uniref:NADPH:adrenodoxin oxidoreductase, mitochondrial-like isoform X2 n=1 Tax=Physella acuta TaxID=109671 RepID=UPI0027DB5DA3|nr:NADPH:adrenodoxin oxidoreductase, mitochondrial-like isoform X2 [Physella acuta]
MQFVKGASWCLTKAIKTNMKFEKFKALLNYRCLSTDSGVENNKKPLVAIVGSGPAGFYTAQQLLKGNPNVLVDIYEKLPVPFGLVRFGVAPDHPEVKNVIHTFTQTANNDRCSFLGNVEVGKDVTLQDLRKIYSAVVLCYGAADDRLLGIPGEDLPNVLSARSFVGWYNGLPQDKHLQVDLDCEAAVVIGHGNVALDVARVLLTPVGILEKTDITEHALEALTKSRIKKVYVVGRRGPLQVAFTIKELREMVNLPDTRTILQPDDLVGCDKIIEELPRPRRRLTELMVKSALSPSADNLKHWADASREWRLVFKRSPVSIKSSSSGKLAGVEFVVNKLEGDIPEKQKVVATDLKETIECGLVLRSIGYRSLSIDGSVPFNTAKGVVDHENSRVRNEKGLYCAGWVGNGPVGVILGTMTDGFETGKVILQDINSGSLESKETSNRDNLIGNIKTVTFSEWEKIDQAEVDAGTKKGKLREKFTDIEEMIRTAKV